MEWHNAEKDYERSYQRFPEENMGAPGGHYYYDANHNPVLSHVYGQNEQPFEQPFNEPFDQPNMQGTQPPISPYEMYAKPSQPQGWAGQMNEEYFQEPVKKENLIKTHFYDENGQMDIQKMLSTVNQLANTVQQVTPVIQQIGSLVRLIR